MSEHPIALVFGGSRGIGAAAVTALRADGYRVGWTHVGPDSGTDPDAFQLDVRDAAAVEEVFGKVAERFGAMPDCVVANAGINVPPAPIAQVDPEVLRQLFEVNLFGAFNVLQSAARHCRDGGSIIGVSTALVRFALPGAGPYIATKGALECLLRSLQKELAPRRIRVNAVAPGPVDTDLFRSGKTEEAIRRSAALSPFDRIGRPEEVGAVIAFLASDKASWVAGQVVQPNGALV